MAVLDLANVFTQSGGVLTPYAPTTVASNFNGVYIDRIATQDDGPGSNINFVVNVTTAVTAAGGAATVQFQLVGNATDPTFSSGNIILCDSGAIAKATLIAGYKIALKVPRIAFASEETSSTAPRYWALFVIIATNTLTTGAFESYVGPDGIVADNIAYPAGYTV